MKILKIHALERGWHDKDEILLPAAFQLLVDFIEQEHPDRIEEPADQSILNTRAWLPRSFSARE